MLTVMRIRPQVFEIETGMTKDDEKIKLYDEENAANIKQVGDRMAKASKLFDRDMLEQYEQFKKTLCSMEQSK